MTWRTRKRRRIRTTHEVGHRRSVRHVQRIRRGARFASARVAFACTECERAKCKTTTGSRRASSESRDKARLGQLRRGRRSRRMLPAMMDRQRAARDRGALAATVLFAAHATCNGASYNGGAASAYSSASMTFASPASTNSDGCIYSHTTTAGARQRAAAHSASKTPVAAVTRSISAGVLARA